MVDRFNAIPATRSAISKSGLTTREFVLIQGANLQAGSAHAMLQMGFSPDSALKATQASKPNLEFYRKNEPELNQILKEAQPKSPAFKKSLGDRDLGEDESE
jgi:hypothetical protein